jgi:FkbM family methyltransferase
MSLFYRGIYEEQIVARIAALLRPGMTFVDIGANIGLHTLVAAHRVGNIGQVIAVEPQSRVYERLLHNVTLNGLRNVRAFRCAVGSAGGIMPLFQLSTENDGLATLRVRDHEEPVGSETVEVMTLPALLAVARVEHVHGIKIDTEGAELSILKGAEAWLSRSPPAFMAIECNDAHLRRFGASSLQLIRFLQATGYRVLALRRGRWRTLRAGEDESADLLALL